MIEILRKRFLTKEKSPFQSFIQTDVHAHWLPGIDDGARNIQESLLLIENLVKIGYQQLIATPHVMSDYYPNQPADILAAFERVQQAVAEAQISVKLSFAAEYYLDEWLWAQLEQQQKLLSFGKNYVLFETAFGNAPPFLESAIRQMQLLGYQPVLAHPERYQYFWENEKRLFQLKDQGLLLQVNLNSLRGYYSLPAEKLALKLLEKGLIDFVGTDCHRMAHLEYLPKLADKPRILEKLAKIKLLNDTI